jgi:hypothetical protein
MWYRLSKKIIKAEDEQDPLGISDIKPTGLSDDPYVKKLNALIKSGLMTESEFFDEMIEKRPDLVQNMITTSQMPNHHEIDRMVSHVSNQGIRVNPKDRDVLAKFYDITAYVYLDFIKELESDFTYILKNLASKGDLPQEYFSNIDDHNSGMLLGDLIEPSTNEQFLSREYLELRSAGIDISEAIKMISDGDFSTIEEAFRDFIDRYVSVLAQKASRVTGFQYYEDDITRKFEEKQISLDNLNSTVEDTLAELYYIYKS